MNAGVIAAAGGAAELLRWRKPTGLSFTPAALPFGIGGVRHERHGW